MQQKGKTNLKELIQSMNPVLNEGAYVFTTVSSVENIPRDKTICEFKEQEGITVVLEKPLADQLNLPYSYVASWITLNVHSALEAVGLTAAFATELANHDLSCNVIAGYFHDHIFVDIANGAKAIEVLRQLAKKA